MKPFARINLSSAALRRGILVSSLAREGSWFAHKERNLKYEYGQE